MARFAVLVSLASLFFVNASFGQTTGVSDPQALSLPQKAMTALVGNASLVDVKLQGNVVSVFGADSETGTGTFQAKGSGESRGVRAGRRSRRPHIRGKRVPRRSVVGLRFEGPLEAQ